MASVEVIHRGKVFPVPNAILTKLASNAWEIAIPRADPVHAQTRRQPAAEAWDGAIFLVNGVETDPAIGSGENASFVLVTVLALG